MIQESAPTRNVTLLKIVGIFIIPVMILIGLIIFLFFFVGPKVIPSWYMEPASTRTLIPLNVNVSKDMITMDVTSPKSSFSFVSGYRTEYREDILYITFLWTAFEEVASKPWEEISIPNTFGDIKQIYQRGYTKDDVRLIWPVADKKSVAE